MPVIYAVTMLLVSEWGDISAEDISVDSAARIATCRVEKILDTNEESEVAE